MKFAICNELFEGDDFAAQCLRIASHGYGGVEVAPFTLAERPTEIDAAGRRRLRDAAEAAGLEVVGLHWLLAKTTGLHATTADAAVRRRTSEYLAELADLCADLGGAVMVLGSPRQRSLEPGVGRDEADRNFVEVIGRVVPTLERRGVTLCLEPLGPNETDYLNTCSEARGIINRIGSPSVALHQDVKAMLNGEGRPLSEVIDEFSDVTRHFHANDVNLLGPGMGETDFGPIFDALARTGYAGWVSVEVFDFAPGADAIAAASLAHMRSHSSRA